MRYSFVIKLVAATIILFLGASLPLRAYYDIFSVNNGMSSNMVHSILKDSKGIMWLGTSFGLNKFDGQNFRVFVDNNHENSIHGNIVTSLCETPDGLIWAGTEKALCALDRKTGNWKYYQIKKGVDVSFLRIVVFGEKLLIFTFDRGVHLFDPKTGIFTLMDEASYVVVVLPVSEKKCWFYLNSILYLMEIDDKQVITKKSFFLSEIKNDKVVGMKINNAGEMELLAHQAIFYYKLAWRPVFLKKTSLPFSSRYMLSGTRTILTLDTNGDFSIKDSRGYRTIQLPTIGGRLSAVYSVYEAGNITWVGTDNGLIRVRRTSNAIEFFNHERGLKYDYVRSIFNYNDTVLIIGAKNGGITVIHNFRSVINGEEPRTSTHFFVYPTNRDGMISTNCFFKLKNGDVLVGTVFGLYLLKKGFKENARKIITNSHKLNEANIWTFFEDNGEILIGTSGDGMFRFDVKTGSAKEYPYKGQDSKGQDVYSFYRWADRMYIGTSDGLYVKKGAGYAKPVPLTGIPDYCHIWKMMPYDDHSLLLSTTNCGLYKYDIYTGKTLNISMEDSIGLSSNTLSGLLANGTKSFFVSSRSGLNILDHDLSKNTVLNFTGSVADNNYNFNSTETFLDGSWLLFGTTTGLILIDRNRVYNEHPQNPYIGGFKVFDQVRFTELDNQDTVWLQSKENFFSFEFSLIDKVPYGQKFVYMLQGYDKDWRRTASGVVSYTGLDPGNYTFRLKAEDPLTPIGEAGTITVQVIIIPEFYQTPWFKIILGLSLVGLLVLVLMSVLRRKTFEKRLVEIEGKLLRLQMNPHFMFNSLTSIQHFILKEDKLSAIKYLARFSKLIRIILNNSRKESILLSEEIVFLDTYLKLEGLRMEDFRFNIEIRETVRDGIMVPPMIFQPFVENAIKHGLLHKEGEKLVEIIFGMKGPTTLHCIISDNGIGRQRSMEMKQLSGENVHRSMGLELMKNRLQIFGKLKNKDYNFEITDNGGGDENRGTKVELYMEVFEL